MKVIDKTCLAEAHTWRNTNKALAYHVQIDVMEICLPGRVVRLGTGVADELEAALAETVIPD